MQNKVTDEMLMAYADGELDEANARAVALSIEDDPELGMRVVEFQRVRLMAKAAYGHVLEEPAPDRLIVAAFGRGRVSGLLGAADRRLFPVGSWLSFRPLRFAGAFCSVAFMAGLGGYLLARMIAAPPQEMAGLPPMDGALAALLETGLSGEERPWGAGKAVVAGTWRIEDGVCRTFVLKGGANGATNGAACQRDGAWIIEIAVRKGGDGDESFAPASDRATQTLDAFLSAAGAGEALDANAEKLLRDGGWR